MSVAQALALLALMGAASYFQTVTGFGLGMIVIGTASGLNLAPVASVAALVSLVTLANSAVALPGKLHHIDWRAVGAATLGLLPSVVAGVLLLDYLSGRASGILQFLLGAVVLYGGLSAALRPAPLAQRSGDRSFFMSGVFGGLLSGMFGVSGPPLVFQIYRQPLSLVQIRCALIVLFAATALIRTLFSAWHGQLGREVWTQAVLAVPVVALATVAARRYPPPLSGVTTRRIAFGVLVLIGCYLTVSAVIGWVR
ncbi:membrane protein [Caballeronia glathei]|uniref:Probable membrane transporter protein n=2 Tax=Caballeronia glathei TaxID=60547 RepID=A0A069PB59_9BURK|nr:membrane protein [Caballeronia glathei]